MSAQAPAVRRSKRVQSADSAATVPHTPSVHDRLHQRRADRGEGARLEKRIGELRQDVRHLRGRGATLSADPQAELLARLTRGWLGVRDVGPGLALLLALVIEVVSAFGPVVVAGYAEATRGDEARTVSQPTRLVVTGRDTPRPAAALGEENDLVMEYMAERIAPTAEAHAIGGDEIFSVYLAWCGRKKCAPLALDESLHNSITSSLACAAAPELHDLQLLPACASSRQDVAAAVRAGLRCLGRMRNVRDAGERAGW